MRSALILLMASASCWGQIEIHYSRQTDTVTKGLIGTVPKDVALYRAEVRNVGSEEARLFPDRVGFEASAIAPMQDPEAAVSAAKGYKSKKWLWLRLIVEAAPYIGPGVLVARGLGWKIPDWGTTTAGVGTTAIAGADRLYSEGTSLNIPTTWLKDNLPEIVLRPGQGAAYLLALGGKPPETFKATIAKSATVQSKLEWSNPIYIQPAENLEVLEMPPCPPAGTVPDPCVRTFTWSPLSISSTHPQVDEDAPYVAILDRLDRESTARVGASQ